MNSKESCDRTVLLLRVTKGVIACGHGLPISAGVHVFRIWHPLILQQVIDLMFSPGETAKEKKI